jgi:hypothetical protein
MRRGVTKPPVTVDTLVKWRDRYDSLAESVTSLAFGAGFLGALFEGYRWLQTAVWQPANGWALIRLLVYNAWLEAPDRMLGLHKIVSALLDMPLFLTAPFAAWLVVWGFAQSSADWCRTELAAAGYVEPEADDYADVA